MLHYSEIFELPKYVCQIPSADGSPTIAIPKNIMSLPLDKDIIDPTYGTPPPTISAASSQWKHLCAWKITVVVIVISKYSMKEQKADVSAILTSLTFMLGHVRHLVIAIGQSSYFFNIDSKTSSLKSMQAILEQALKLDPHNEGVFCDAMLRQFPPGRPGALRSLIFTLHDIDTWKWYQKTISPKTGPADRRLHLMTRLDLEDDFFHTPFKVASLQWLSFFDGSHHMGIDLKSGPVDYTKCDRMIEINLKAQSHHGAIGDVIIPPRNPTMLESLVLNVSGINSARPLLTFDKVYPRLRRLEMPMCSRIYGPLTSERFPVLQQFCTVPFADRKELDLSALSNPGLEILLKGQLAEIKLPAKPLARLHVDVRNFRNFPIGDAIWDSITLIHDLSLDFHTQEDLEWFSQNINGVPPAAGQPFAMAHLRRMRLCKSYNGVLLDFEDFSFIRPTTGDRSSVILRGENFPSLETLECSHNCTITLLGEFPSLCSLKLKNVALGVDSKFTAPLLQALSFDRVDNLNHLEVGRAKFPSLQLVSLHTESKLLELKEAHIPHLITDAKLDHSPLIVLRMGENFPSAHGKQLRAALPDWLTFATCCTLPVFE